jgi:hypothetical protein
MEGVQESGWWPFAVAVTVSSAMRESKKYFSSHEDRGVIFSFYPTRDPTNCSKLSTPSSINGNRAHTYAHSDLSN